MHFINNNWHNQSRITRESNQCIYIYVIIKVGSWCNLRLPWLHRTIASSDGGDWLILMNAKRSANASGFHLKAFSNPWCDNIYSLTVVIFPFRKSINSIHNSNVHQTDFVRESGRSEKSFHPCLPSLCMHSRRSVFEKHWICKLANIFHSKLTFLCLERTQSSGEGGKRTGICCERVKWKVMSCHQSRGAWLRDICLAGAVELGKSFPAFHFPVCFVLETHKSRKSCWDIFNWVSSSVRENMETRNSRWWSF